MIQSPEISGGGGFSFEDASVAFYLSALLGEGSGPGLEGRIVTRVAVQQAAFGEPLDDLVIDGRASDDSLARLSLQVKRQLTVSAAESNTDFREVVTRAQATAEKPEFRQCTDRVGVVTGTISESSRRALNTVCEWARASNSVDVFLEHFQPGIAGNERRGILNTFRTILSESASGSFDDAQVFNLLRHFVLIRLDVLHEGATDESNVVEQLRFHLHEPDRSRGLWTALLRIAREGGGCAAEFSRASLLANLHGAFRFAGAVSLRRDLERIREETANALAAIANCVDGFQVRRHATVQRVTTALESRRFVHLLGLPGTGKSAVLRACVESEHPNGTTLLIKSDRLSGPNWAAYVTSLGLTAIGVEPLLSEIAATGSSILFVDGIDRVEIQHRGVLRDLLSAIVTSPALAEWKVVATSRDSGIEPLRTWLPSAFLSGTGVSSIVVEPFDDDESAALAQAKPALRPLLFGDERVSAVARRPFFAAILAQTFGQRDSREAPRSEVELIEVWWTRGGYDSDEQHSNHRQQALIQLAESGAVNLGRRMPLGNVNRDAIRDLKLDNVVKEVTAGHSVRFAHDIFFEWAFLHLLIDSDEKWLEVIRSVGEPPALGRVVELLSQLRFGCDDEWEETLANLESLQMRAQWTRAWIIAPFGLPTFLNGSARFTEAMLRGNAERASRLTVWFQAEKTRANPMILDHSLTEARLSRAEVVLVADALAWPSDIPSWGRFCNWTLDGVRRFPVAAVPDLISGFEVWQNMFGNVPNPVSNRIVEAIAAWLEDIEDRRHSEEFGYNPGPWSVLKRGMLQEIEERLRFILCRAARSEHERVRNYLQRVTTRRALRHHAFRQILILTPILSVDHADEVIELTLGEVRRPLPADIAARPMMPGDRYPSFDHHDRRELAIEDDHQCFWPPSPLREPFAALFERSPEKGLALTRDLSNHAIAAWRQLFTFGPEERGTPLPLRLVFPWGEQDFWGGGQVYLWPRGHWGPHPVVCALMALERWAFKEVERGRGTDDVIQDLVRGHESCAVLSIAVMLALDAKRVSGVSLPLVTSQQIWDWDIDRCTSDLGVGSNLVGFGRGRDQIHRDAVDAENRRAARGSDIRALAQIFVISGDEDLRSRAQRLITSFPEKLPFEFEEEKSIEAHVLSIRRRAEIWSEVGRPENYRARKSTVDSSVYITMNNPTASDPDMVAIAQHTARLNEQLTVLQWGRKSLDAGVLSPELSVADAVQKARAIDRDDLFAAPHDGGDETGRDQGAVAAAGAAILACGAPVDDHTSTWAVSTVMRACRTPEKREVDAVHLHHPALFAVNGLVGLIKRGLDVAKAKRELLSLGGHIVEDIGEKAIGAALSLWKEHPKLAWAALYLGIERSVTLRPAPSFTTARQSVDPSHLRSAVGKAVAQLDAAAINHLLPTLPDAWVLAPPTSREGGVDGDPLSQEPIWRRPDRFLRSSFMAKLLAMIPVSMAVSDVDRRDAFLAFSYGLLDWTSQRLRPSWRQPERSRRMDRTTELLEWRTPLGQFLAKLALVLEPSEVQREILDPIFSHDDEIAASLIRPFAGIVAAAGILDPPAVAASAVRYMEACVQRILAHQAWQRAREDDGNISGFDLPEIVREVLFATGLQASLATRFANGDWRDIGAVHSIVDPFVRAVGDIPDVISSFLTLCENAGEHYPPHAFVEQVAAVLEKQDGTPIGWRGRGISNRIAALVHSFAERSQPLPVALGQGMLRILDRLVDMGDRRSASLQGSEIFRGVRL